MSRRTGSTEATLAVVLERLKGQEPVTRLCHWHGVALNQAYRWRDAVLERGKLGLKDQRHPTHRDPVQEENRRLRELAGGQARILEAQKQLAGMPAFGGNGSW